MGGIETIDNTPVPGSLGEELIYRRFKVSGGINLDAFQDKVLSPVMGW